jgi:hypothetical protein
MNFCTLCILLTLMTIDTGYLHLMTVDTRYLNLMPFSSCVFHDNRFTESHTFSLKAESFFIFSTSVVRFCMKIRDSIRNMHIMLLSFCDFYEKRPTKCRTFRINVN